MNGNIKIQGDDSGLFTEAEGMADQDFLGMSVSVFRVLTRVKRRMIPSTSPI